MEGAAAARSTSTKSSTEKADPGRGIKKLLARSARAHTSSKARRLHTVDVRSNIKSGLQKRKRPLLWSPRRRANPFGKRQQALMVDRAYKPSSKIRASRDKRRALDRKQKIPASRAHKLQDAIDAIRRGRWLLI